MSSTRTASGVPCSRHTAARTVSSPALPFRRSLLDEGAGTLARVFTAEHDRLELAQSRPRARDVDSPEPDELFDRADREGTVARDAVGDLDRACERFVGGDDGVDEAELRRRARR